VAVSLAPQCQPQSMRGPGGRPPRLGFGGRCRIVSGTVGRRGHCVKCRRIWLVVSLAPQPHPHGIRGPGDRPIRLMAFGSSFQIVTRTVLLHLLHLPDKLDCSTAGQGARACGGLRRSIWKPAAGSTPKSQSAFCTLGTSRTNIDCTSNVCYLLGPTSERIVKPRDVAQYRLIAFWVTFCVWPLLPFRFPAVLAFLYWAAALSKFDGVGITG